MNMTVHKLILEMENLTTGPPTRTNTTEEGINSVESSDRAPASRLLGEAEPLKT